MIKRRTNKLESAIRDGTPIIQPQAPVADKPLVTQKRATSVSLQGMVKRFSLAQEDAYQLILETMNDPTADLKDRLICAKFFATQYPALLKQAESALASKQLEVLNGYRIRQAAKAEAEADEDGGERAYKGIKAISLDIPDDMEGL